MLSQLVQFIFLRNLRLLIAHIGFSLFVVVSIFFFLFVGCVFLVG